MTPTHRGGSGVEKERRSVIAKQGGEGKGPSALREGKGKDLIKHKKRGLEQNKENKASEGGRRFRPGVEEARLIRKTKSDLPGIPARELHGEKTQGEGGDRRAFSESARGEKIKRRKGGRNSRRGQSQASFYGGEEEEVVSGKKKRREWPMKPLDCSRNEKVNKGEALKRNRKLIRRKTSWGKGRVGRQSKKTANNQCGRHFRGRPPEVGEKWGKGEEREEDHGRGLHYLRHDEHKSSVVNEARVGNSLTLRDGGEENCRERSRGQTEERRRRQESGVPRKPEGPALRSLANKLNFRQKEGNLQPRKKGWSRSSTITGYPFFFPEEGSWKDGREGRSLSLKKRGGGGEIERKKKKRKLREPRRRDQLLWRSQKRVSRQSIQIAIGESRWGGK